MNFVFSVPDGHQCYFLDIMKYPFLTDDLTWGGLKFIPAATVQGKAGCTHITSQSSG